MFRSPQKRLTQYDRKKIPPSSIIVLVILVVLSCSSGSNSSEKKENNSLSILSYFQQKKNLENTPSLVLSDSKLWQEKIKTKKQVFLSSLQKIYFEKKMENLYLVTKKKGEEESLKIGFPGINNKDNFSLQLPYPDLELAHSEGDLRLYRYRVEAKSFVAPQSEGISKNIDWINWKLMDALFPVRLHKNKKSFLTGNNSREFIVDNRFTYFFVSKDAIFAKTTKETLVLLLYAQKSEEPPTKSIRSCWVSLYIVDQQRKMQVLNMADINLDIEKQLVGNKKGWLLRAQLVQVPHQIQGIGFALRSEISVQFDDFVLFIFN
jgi:hypothetical protein